MEQMFMARRSAVARIIEELRQLPAEAEVRGWSPSEVESRARGLERLLFDVRAGRLSEFTLPAQKPLRVFVTPA